MIRDFAAGWGYLGRGYRLILSPGLRRYLVLPLAVNVLVFAAVIGFGVHYLGDWLQRGLPAGRYDWMGVVRVLAWITFGLTVMLALFFGFNVGANLIAAPFNGWLSEAVARRLDGGGGPRRPAAGRASWGNSCPP